jgi:hypothetical protein
MFCNTLWIMDHGQVDVLQQDKDETATTFDDLFADYRSHIMSSSAAANRSNERRIKADMVKRAKQQTAGTSKKTTLVA